MRLTSLLLSISTCLASVAVPGSVFAAKQLKFGILTPEGTTWTKLVKEMGKELSEKTNGELTMKVAAGGVKGDEPDMLRAMPSGSLNSGAFSGVGLGEIVPSIRILEAPLLFRTNEELDKVKEVLFDDFAKDFEKKGFVLLGFAEAGFVNVFSKQKIDNEAALKKIKMWVWSNDKVAALFLNEFGIKTNPFILPEVSTQLSTGTIDSFYSPPLAAIGFQWFQHVKFMMDYPFVNSTGAMIVKKDFFEKLPADQQKLLRETAHTYAKKVVEATREDNKKALDELKKSGIEFLKPSAEDIKKFESYAQNVYKKSIPDIYSQQLFDKVQGVLKGMRK